MATEAPRNIDLLFDKLLAEADDDEDNEIKTINKESTKKMSVNLQAIREKILALQAARKAAEDQAAAGGDWLRKKAGTEDYYLVPFSEDEIWQEHNTMYLNGKHLMVSPIDKVTVVQSYFWKLKNAVGDDKELTKKVRSVETTDMVFVLLQHAKTGEVKLHKMKKGYKNHLVGAKLAADMLKLIEDGDDPTQFRLTITAVDKSMGDGKSYVEESIAFARKPSKPPAITGNIPTFDSAYIAKDDLKAALEAYATSIGLSDITCD